VVGAGIFGLCCGWELARRGARVTVIESDRIGAGPSGGTVGALAPHAPGAWNPKKQIQLDALIAAQGWWDTVRKAGGTEYHRQLLFDSAADYGAGGDRAVSGTGPHIRDGGDSRLGAFGVTGRDRPCHNRGSGRRA